MAIVLEAVHSDAPATPRAGTLRRLLDCLTRAHERDLLAEMDHRMRADIGVDRVIAELNKSFWAQ